MKENFLILGGDKRQEYLLNLLKTNGFTAELFFNNISCDKNAILNKINNYKNIILPIPVSKDNKTLNAPNYCEKISLKEINANLSKESRIFYAGDNYIAQKAETKEKIDLFKNEELTLKNAMATAEGALSLIIDNTESTIFGKKILILGFGRIGKILADYLKALHGEICVAIRRPEIKAEAEIKAYKTLNFKNLKDNLAEFDIIINTVPSKVLGKEELLNIKNDALILDLASSPGGLDFAEANKLSKRAILALGLPGKFSPKSAAEYIYSAILFSINNKESGVAYERC